MAAEWKAGTSFMGIFGDAARTALLVALAVGFIPAGERPALAASIQFIGGNDDIDNSWENPANWSTSSVPGSGDDVTVPASDLGAVILDGQSESVKSLQLNSSLSVGVDNGSGSSLTVIDGITNNGGGYFINNGTVTANTYTSGSQYGYVANLHDFTANLDNSGVVINGDGAEGLTGVTWTGDVSNGATGYISNTGGQWTGDVTGNAGTIYNDFAGTWTGDVKSNSGYIENTAVSTWSGKVVGNDAEKVIVNLDGATWIGDVQSNDGSIDNDGGTWTGNVVSNNGGIVNTLGSTWNGNITSSGSLWLAGTVNGFIDSSGGMLYVGAPLSGVTSLTATGGLVMGDGSADVTLSAQSWSGTGAATFDFAPGLGRSDHVVLSGNYTADTTIGLNLVGPTGRALVDIPLIEVGGADTGSLDVSGLPEDGVISYRLVENGAGWIVTTTLNDAPEHAVSAAALLTRSATAATLVPTDRADACGDGRWMRTLGSAQNGTLSGTHSGLALGGVQVGNDIDCIKIGDDATFGIGVTAGGLGGILSEDFGAGDSLNGTFGEGFGGLYGDLAAGRLHAMLQGQVGIAGLGISDPQSAVGHATLTNTRFNLGGDATYELRLGTVAFVPEAGFLATNAVSTSGDFADVGAMKLTGDPTVDAYAGATVRGHMALPHGTTIMTPYVSLLLHDGLLSPGSALFTDLAGGSAAVPLDQLGSYGALGVGADLLRAPGASGRMMRAGVHADFKFGSNIAESSYGAYAQMRF